MAQLHEALGCLRPKDFSEIPLDQLEDFLSEILAKAETIANSVPPPPNGAPYESCKRSRTDANGATCAADLTISNARRPPPSQEQAELQKCWGKPLKLGKQDTATGISVYKMAAHDRHGAWFARSSVHEGLGFAKWKRAMMREFPESLTVEAGPGEGSVRGIGGDKRLEDVEVKGLGKLEVYQLSAQFPGPVAPREFITLLLTSTNALSDASRIDNTIPRHFIVVSIPLTHPDAPPRDGLVRGFYESVEMIREIPLVPAKSQSASTSDLLKHGRTKSRERGGTIGFAESRGPDAKGERIDRKEEADDDDPETNPVEWTMITRSDPGGGIPRFMVERGTPSSIVQDAGKFLDWACSKDDFPTVEKDEEIVEEATKKSFEGERRFSISESNGILAGVGTSIADRPMSHRTHSQRTIDREGHRPGILRSVTDSAGSYISDPRKSLQRSDSISSVSTSSIDSFASAEQGLPVDRSLPTPSSISEQSLPRGNKALNQSDYMSRELQKIEQKRQQLKEQLDQARNKQGKEKQDASAKTAKELEKTTEKHNRERKKQEEKFQKEVQKLDQRRERETKKLLARQQKEADKDSLLRTQRERDEWKQKAELAEQENQLLKQQIGELQKENTSLVARLGKSEFGRDLLRKVKEDLEGKGSRNRASSRASAGSGTSKGSGKGGKKGEHLAGPASSLTRRQTTPAS